MKFYLDEVMKEDDKHKEPINVFCLYNEGIRQQVFNLPKQLINDDLKR